MTEKRIQLNGAGALLIPIYLDALVLEKDETVLEPMVDFSRLPYYDHISNVNINADVPYLSEEIVSHPMRDRSLRLKSGVHLHWALPDALSKGVSTKDGLVFPALPDRWLVTRRNKEGTFVQKQWMVESDYLHPELDPEADPPADTVSFPLPPREGRGQPFRYLGRKWVVRLDAENALTINFKKESGAEYLNALSDVGEKPKTNWHKVVGAGLTAIGYGEPSFAAFYPNCRSVFGLHDPDISNEEAFKNVSYDVIGWYDQPEKRDILNSDSFRQTQDAIKLRITNEYKASGHEVIVPDSLMVWQEALAHHFGWNVDPFTGDFPKRIFCFASLKPDTNLDIKNDPAHDKSAVDIAVGNNASEALSAYLAHRMDGEKGIIEEQLEALDLEGRLEHRQLDIGPKFREARHNKGFKAVRSGILWTLRLERDSSTPNADHPLSGASATKEVHAQIQGTLPPYLAHLLNKLNGYQAGYERSQENMSARRLQIYHDWTLYMKSLRPPDGLQSGYPDPMEIAQYIEKNGFIPLKQMMAETGSLQKSKRENDSRNGPVESVTASEFYDDNALATRLAACITELVDGLKISNNILDLLQRLDMELVVAQKSGSIGTNSGGESRGELFALNKHSGGVNSAHFDHSGKRIVTASDDGTAKVWDTYTGEELLTVSTSQGFVNSASFSPQSEQIVTAGSNGTVKIWKTDTGEELLTLSAHGKAVNSASFSPTGDRIVTAGNDSTAKVWDAKTGELLLTLIGHNECLVISAAFDTEGKRIVTAGTDSLAIVWDAKTGEILQTLSGHNVDVASASYDPKGRRIVTVGSDYTVRIWDADDGKELLRLRRPTNEGGLCSACFDPRGKYIVTGSWCLAKVLDAKSGVEFLTFAGHTGWVNSVAYDPEGKRIVTTSNDGTVKVWRANSLGGVLRSFLDERNFSYRKEDSLQTLRNRIHDCAAALSGKAEQDQFHYDLQKILPNVKSTQGQTARMRYALRQKDAPRYNLPTDPVVLLAGKDLKPTERHGTDGKLKCEIVPDLTLSSVGEWKDYTAVKSALGQLNKIHDAILKEKQHADQISVEQLNKTGDANQTKKLDADQIGARIWTRQPWHPFLMEWEAEMFPISAGSNREEGRETYASSFIAQNYTLPASAVDLTLKPGVADATQTANTGIYSGSCVLTDQAPSLLLAKLNLYLDKVAADSKVESEKASPNPAITKSETADKLQKTLTEARNFLQNLPGALSQSLDGFHEALLQRHRILQLPIADPIGFSDRRPFTEAVREATQGLHDSSPLRDNDFTPIRSGKMKLRQLRLVDTFGRVKSVLDPTDKTPILASETLRVKDVPNEINLPPRLLQPARLSFRWLSANPAAGTKMDEPESNTHPAFTPVCGWIVPNNLDGSLMFFDNQGGALGTISKVEGNSVWQPAPGIALPLWKIEQADAEILNPHLGKLISSIVNNISKKDNLFFKEFLATLDNALENISPEDFSHHESLALLMGRPIAVVRAVVDIELRGLPAANQSLSSFVYDMKHAAAAPGSLNKHTRFRLPRADQALFLKALRERSVAGIRPAFTKLEIELPPSDGEVKILFEDIEPPDSRWRIVLPTRSYLVRQHNDAIHIYLDTNRTTDGFTHVRFPIRIGEFQQLNDGLLGYFLEDFDGEDYHYRDTCFFAPQAAANQPIDLSIPLDEVSNMVDQLDTEEVPQVIVDALKITSGAIVTIDKTGQRWRIDTAGHVYNIVYSDTGLALSELLDTSSDHIKVHWKEPVNINLSVDGAPQKLTMLVDPQGSVHAVSGILPTKSITIPKEHYIDSLRKLELSFLSTPILTELEKILLPLAAEEGYQWSWLIRKGDQWIEIGEIDKINLQATFSSKQKIVEGWLKLRKVKKS